MTIQYCNIEQTEMKSFWINSKYIYIYYLTIRNNCWFVKKGSLFNNMKDKNNCTHTFIVNAHYKSTANWICFFFWMGQYSVILLNFELCKVHLIVKLVKHRFNNYWSVKLMVLKLVKVPNNILKHAWKIASKSALLGEFLRSQLFICHTIEYVPVYHWQFPLIPSSNCPAKIQRKL